MFLDLTPQKAVMERLFQQGSATDAPDNRRADNVQTGHGRPDRRTTQSIWLEWRIDNNTRPGWLDPTDGSALGCSCSEESSCWFFLFF